jgi:hypothetical protein
MIALTDAKASLAADQLGSDMGGPTVQRSSGDVLSMYKIARDPLSSLLIESTLENRLKRLSQGHQTRILTFCVRCSCVGFFVPSGLGCSGL